MLNHEVCDYHVLEDCYCYYLGTLAGGIDSAGRGARTGYEPGGSAPARSDAGTTAGSVMGGGTVTGAGTGRIIVSNTDTDPVNRAVTGGDAENGAGLHAAKPGKGAGSGKGIGTRNTGATTSAGSSKGKGNGRKIVAITGADARTCRETGLGLAYSTVALDKLFGRFAFDVHNRFCIDSDHGFEIGFGLDFGDRYSQDA